MKTGIKNTNPETIAASFKEKSITAPTTSNISKSHKALRNDSKPLARGRIFVLLTFASIFLSIISLITHPALRIIIAPRAKSPNKYTSGNDFCDAIAILHQHGHKRSQIPVG